MGCSGLSLFATVVILPRAASPGALHLGVALRGVAGPVCPFLAGTARCFPPDAAPQLRDRLCWAKGGVWAAGLREWLGAGDGTWVPPG